MNTAVKKGDKDPVESVDAVDQLIEQYDPESNFRQLAGLAAMFVTIVSVSLSGWHVYTAGFGLHNEIAHRAIHLSVVLGLCFLVFPRQKPLAGAWEWILPITLGSFYILFGWWLVQALGEDLPESTALIFMALLTAVALLTLPIKALDGSHTSIPIRDWFFAAISSGFSLYLLVFFGDLAR